LYIPLLKKITSEGRVSAGITDIFNFEKLFEESDIVSLLFYMGWLTIEGMEEGEYVFKMPNRVIQEVLILVGREWHLIEEIPIVRA
jgi:hypothetical protein